MFFLDTDWNQLPFNINVPLELDADLPRPANLEKMLDIARTLSQGYTAVRVTCTRSMTAASSSAR